MALRLCPCGAPLEDVGPAVLCFRCGSPATVWLVSSYGALVAVATSAEVMPGPALRDGLRYAARATWAQEQRLA